MLVQTVRFKYSERSSVSYYINYRFADKPITYRTTIGTNAALYPNPRHRAISLNMCPRDPFICLCNYFCTLSYLSRGGCWNPVFFFSSLLNALLYPKMTSGHCYSIHSAYLRETKLPITPMGATYIQKWVWGVVQPTLY